MGHFDGLPDPPKATIRSPRGPESSDWFRPPMARSSSKALIWPELR